jgi:hypothetical protein
MSDSDETGTRTEQAAPIPVSASRPPEATSQSQEGSIAATLPRLRRWLIAGLVLLVLLNLGAVMTRLRSAHFFLSARSDAIHLRIAEPYATNIGMHVFDWRVTGAQTAELPDGRTARVDGRMMSLGSSPAGSGSAVPPDGSIPSLLAISAPGCSEIEIRRRGPARYSFGFRGMRAHAATREGMRLTFQLPPGRAIVLDEKEMFATNEVSGPLVIHLGAPGELVFGIVASDSSVASDIGLAALAFVAEQAGKQGSERRSGLLGGDLAFLETIEQSTLLRRGANLRLELSTDPCGESGRAPEHVAAVLHSLVLGSEDIQITATGLVHDASLSVGPGTRSLMPSYFEWISHQRQAAFFAALWSLVLTLVVALTEWPGRTH